MRLNQVLSCLFYTGFCFTLVQTCSQVLTVRVQVQVQVLASQVQVQVRDSMSQPVFLVISKKISIVILI